MSRKRERQNEEAGSESELDAAAQAAVDAELLVACSNATVVEVKAALRKGASVNALDKDGQTGLMLACGRAPREAVVPIVELLLRKRFSVALPDGDGWNALHFACLNSSANVVQLLLEADKAAVLRLTGSNMSCLVLCAQRGDRAESLRIATMLIDAGCPVNLPNSSGKTTLMFAAMHSVPEVVSLLVARGADLHARSSNSSRTALHFATLNGVCGREVIPILRAAGVDVMAKDANGLTALCTAMPCQCPRPWQMQWHLTCRLGTIWRVGQPVFKILSGAR
jgi:ankyrin repeat protein